MEAGTNKTRMAIGLFGQNLGSDMVPLLNAGSAALNQFGDEAAQYGLVVTDGQARIAGSLNDSISRLKSSIKGVTRTIGDEFLPFVNPWIDDFRQLIVENRELIGTKVHEYIEKDNASRPSMVFKHHLHSFAKGICT